LQIVTTLVPLLALLTAMHVGLLLGGNCLNERKGCITGLDYGTEHPAWLHAHSRPFIPLARQRRSLCKRRLRQHRHHHIILQPAATLTIGSL